MPLDPLDASTPNFERFVKSQTGEDEANPIPMANIDIPNLLGRAFLLPPEDNGERHMAKIIDIDDHGQTLEDIKFRLKINKDQAEEIMSYNQLMDYIQKGTDAEEDPDSLFKFRDVVAHQGPLESTDPNHKGSKYNVMVEWESGEVTYEPLTLISKDDPITCAVYAKKHDLLDTTGWKHLKRYAKTSKRLIRAVKQSRIRQVRASARYQHGFQVPKDYNDAMRLDKENGNTHWQDAIDLELTQIHEYKVFKDTGKAQFHNGKVVIPDGFQKIRVHFVYAVKHDGRFKARLVADGHLTKEPVESIYSGVVSLRSLRMVVFLSQLNNFEIWGADVGNAYLEAYTDEKLCIIAGPEFKELQGHLLIMFKALYGTRSVGARWHDRLFDILQELEFKPSKADPDVWMRPEPGGTCYEYIAVYVDDLATGKAVTAVLHFLNQTPIDAYTKRQSTVETSTYGSEFVAARTAVYQIIDIRTTLRYLGVPIRDQSYMFGDNRSVVTSSTIPNSTISKRHHLASYHRVREAIAAKFISFHWKNGKNNPADILSKHWEFATVWPLLKPILFWRGETATQLKGSDRIPSTTPGAEPPRDARDSGSARSHSTHLETSSSNRP